MKFTQIRRIISKTGVELLFNKVNIDWRYYTSDTNKQKAVYYDLYMSTRTASDSFVKIGSTEYTDRDVKVYWRR